MNREDEIINLINQCKPTSILELLEQLDSAGINIEEYCTNLINKCEASYIPELVENLKNSDIKIEKYCTNLINKCSPKHVPELVEALIKSNIEFKSHIANLINKCDYDYTKEAVGNLNSGSINLIKDVGIEVLKEITDMKKLKIITLNKLGINNIGKVDEQISDMIKKIKKIGLPESHITKLKNLKKLEEAVHSRINKHQFCDIYSSIEDIESLNLNNIDSTIVKTFYSNFLDVDVQEKKTLNNNLDKDIKFGVEIEFLGLTSEQVLGLEMEGFKFTKDPSVKNYDKETDKIKNEDCSNGEIVSDVMEPYNENDIHNIYKVCKQLRNNGADTNFTCGLHVHVSGDGIDINNPKVLDDLTYDMVFMQDLLMQKMNIYFNRVNSFTKKVPQSLCGNSIEFINGTKYIDNIEYIRTVVPEQIDNLKRYYMLNLQSLKKHGTVEFRLFNLPDAIDENLVIAYADMATSMVNSVRKHGSYGKKIQQAFYNLQDDGLSAEEVNEVVYEEFLNYIDVTPKNKKILTQMDKVFDFYEAKEPEIKGKKIDFYTKNNMKKEEEVLDIGA